MHNCVFLYSEFLLHPSGDDPSSGEWVVTDKAKLWKEQRVKEEFSGTNIGFDIAIGQVNFLAHAAL